MGSKIKKGISIIEVIIAIGVGSMIIVFLIKAAIYINKINKINLEETKVQMYVDEGFTYMDYVENTSDEIDVKDNMIKFRFFKDQYYNWIRIDRQGDIIVSYSSPYSKTTNNIVKNMKSFQVIRIKNVIYIKLIDKKGKIYCKSIAAK